MALTGTHAMPPWKRRAKLDTVVLSELLSLVQAIQTAFVEKHLQLRDSWLDHLSL